MKLLIWLRLLNKNIRKFRRSLEYEHLEVTLTLQNHTDILWLFWEFLFERSLQEKSVSRHNRSIMMDGVWVSTHLNVDWLRVVSGSTPTALAIALWFFRKGARGRRRIAGSEQRQRSVQQPPPAQRSETRAHHADISEHTHCDELKPINNSITKRNLQI